MFRFPRKNNIFYCCFHFVCLFPFSFLFAVLCRLFFGVLEVHIYMCLNRLDSPVNLALLSTAVMSILIYIFFILLCCSYFVFHYSNSSFSFFHTLFFVCIFILSCIEDTQQRSWSHCLSLVTVLHLFFLLRCSPSLFDYLVP